VNGSAIVESLEIDPAGVAHVGLTTPNGALYARVPPPYTTATVLRFPASGAAIVTDAFVASDANATWVVSRSLTLGFFGLYSNGPAYAYESFDGGRSFPRTYALRTVFGANLAPETLALFPDGRPVLAANVTYPDQTFAVSTVPIFDPSPSEGADLVQLGGAPALSSTGSAGNGPAFPGGSASGPGSTGGFGDTGQTGPSLGGPSGGTGNPGSGLPQVPVPQRILGTSGPALPLPFPSVPPVEAATGGVAALAIVGILFTDAGKLLLGGLFASMSTRLERAGVLSNEIRTAVFMEVARRPGVRFEELRRALGLSLGALSYHIGVLERERYIRSVRQWTHRRFFTMGSGMPVPAPATVIDRIGDILLATPGLTVAEVARRLGISRQLARYHLSALERRGFVRRIPGTAAVRYALTAKALQPAEPKPPGSPGGGQAAASVVASAGASAAGSHTEFVPLADPGVVPATTMPDPAGGRPQPPDEAGGSPGGYPQSP
jgi:DNA-binding MarR family transcriptional regulator